MKAFQDLVDLQLRSGDELSGVSDVSLEVDKLLDSTSDVASLLSWQVAEKADQVNVRSAESSDVIPLVVCVGAREGLATREWSLEVLWGDHLDTDVVVRLDDGRDVEVSVSVVSLEANLTKHTWDILSSLGDRVPVADP